MKTKTFRTNTMRNRGICILLTLILCISQFTLPASVSADAIAQPRLVMTLGADLTEEQKAYITSYFGVAPEQVETIISTNADEHRELDGLIPDEQIGTRTLSCALVRPTTSGGIQAKTANMNYVTGNMIVGTLSTSGVIHCEVLTAAPFEVSGTGALTGVIMAYETASGIALDAEKKELATEELVITGDIGSKVGQEQATLVVNDIKIHIVRDQVQGQENVNQVVDEVISVTEQAAEEAAEKAGKAAPAKLGQVEHEKLYNFGYKYSNMGYKYKDVQVTLERVTDNVTKSTGIDDPITDTFTTIGQDSGLSADSILLGTDDAVLGENAIVSATSTVAIGDHPAEPIEVFTGDVALEESGRISADSFIRETDILAFRDKNGKYALMDLNGNMLTESVYEDDFRGQYGNVVATLGDGSGAKGVLDSDGAAVIPFNYPVVSVLNEKWGIGFGLKEGGSEEDYDFRSGGQYYQITQADIYYFDSEEPVPVSSLGRAQYLDAGAKGDFIIVRDRNDLCSLFDSSFSFVDNVSSTYDFREYDPDTLLSEALSNATGYSVGGFRGSYATARDYNIGKEGVIDRYGNLILPLAFDAVCDWNEWLVSGGYFAVEMDGRLSFAVSGGQVTAAYDAAYDDVRVNGMSALYEGDDGSCVIFSGDGVRSDLGALYSDVYTITESRGMLYKAEKSYGDCDLIDWHGNLLVEGAKDYSLSANGNYLIANNGYTSSALYLVNDASPVSIAETAGGASELQAEIKEGASLEAYEGDPVLTPVKEVPGEKFAYGTNLIIVENEDGKAALADLNGKLLTDYHYKKYFDYKEGFPIGEEATDTEKLCGVLTKDGMEIIPCQYPVIKVLNENWIVAYLLNDGGTEDNYDFQDYECGYYLIDQAVIYHVGAEELSHVTLTRDQLEELVAEEDYLNVKDRSTGQITTYDGSFTAVATADRIYDFKQFSAGDVLIKQLKDTTGYDVSGSEFPDGYELIWDYSRDPYTAGIVDMSGTIILPPVFDKVRGYYPEDGSTHYWANGYFCVSNDGKIGYVKEGGEFTCQTDIDVDSFENNGMSGTGQYKDEETWYIVAADGTITKVGNRRPSAVGMGLFWKADPEEDYEDILIDWHGNVLRDKVNSVSASGDGRYLIITEDYREPPVLYAVDGAEKELKEGEGSQAAASEAKEASAEEAETGKAPEAEEESGKAPATEEKTQEAPEAEQEADKAPEDASGQESDDPVAVILNSAIQLADEGLEDNQEAILGLLSSAQLLLGDDHSDAGNLVGSAVTLLSGGSLDAGSIRTLLMKAVELL